MSMCKCKSCGHSTFFQERCNSCSTSICHHCCMTGKLCKECYLTESKSFPTAFIAVAMFFMLALLPMTFADLQIEGLESYSIASDGKYLQHCRGLQCDMEFTIYKNDSTDIHNFSITLIDNSSNTLDMNEYIHTVHLYHNYNITLGNGTYEERREEITFNELETVVKNQISGQTNYFHLYFDLIDETKFFDLVPNYDRAYNEYFWVFPHDTDGSLKYYFDFSNGKPYGEPSGPLFNLGDGIQPFNTNDTNATNYPSTGGININESEQEHYRSLKSDPANARIGFGGAVNVHNELGNNWGVNFWIRGTSADFSGANYNIFRFKEPSGNANLDLITLTNGSIRFDLQDSNANEVQTYIGTISTTFLNSSWRNIHIGLEDLGADVHEFKYYLDSSLLYAINKSGFTGTTWPNSCNPLGGDCSFTGDSGVLDRPNLDLDEIRLYSKVLNQSEIDDLYNGTINQTIIVDPPVMNDTNITQNGTQVIVNVDLEGIEDRMSIYLIALAVILLIGYGVLAKDYLIGLIGAIAGLFTPFMIIETLTRISDVEVVAVLLGVVSFIFVWRFYPLISQQSNKDFE